MDRIVVSGTSWEVRNLKCDTHGLGGILILPQVPKNNRIDENIPLQGITVDRKRPIQDSNMLFIFDITYSLDNTNNRAKNIRSGQALAQKIVDKNIERKEVRANRISGVLRPCQWGPDVVTGYQTGVLPCMGALKHDGTYYILFHLPQNAVHIETLARHIVSTKSCPLEERWALAIQLTKALLKTHEAKVKNRNISSHTTLFVKGKDLESSAGQRTPRNPVGIVSPGFGTLYLASWRWSQLYGDAPRKRQLDWHDDVYMHPEQQSNELKNKLQDFNIGHEIYSLGVCLLEIGMWQVLVERCEDSDGVFHAVCPKLAQITDLKKLPRRKQTLKAFLQKADGCNLLKRRLVTLARENLPSSMGTPYSKLVIKCLECLDEDAVKDWAIDFRKTNTDPGLRIDAIRKVLLGYLETVTIDSHVPGERGA